MGISGPLTQRLVSALIEENIPIDGISNNDSNSCSSENTNIINSNSFKPLQNGIVLEKRVKKELIEQGIIEDEPMKVSVPVSLATFSSNPSWFEARGWWNSLRDKESDRGIECYGWIQS